MAVKVICFYSQKIWIVTIAFFEKEAHLTGEQRSTVASQACVYQTKSAVKKSWLNYKTVCMAANASWGTCCAPVRKVRKVPLDNTAFRDAGRSCAVSVGFFLLFLVVNQSEASLKLYLTPTPFTRSHLFVPNLTRTSILNKRPIWSYPLSGRFFTLYDFCCGLFDFSRCALGM